MHAATSKQKRVHISVNWLKAYYEESPGVIDPRFPMVNTSVEEVVTQTALVAEPKVGSPVLKVISV